MEVLEVEVKIEVQEEDLKREVMESHGSGCENLDV